MRFKIGICEESEIIDRKWWKFNRVRVRGRDRGREWETEEDRDRERESENERVRQRKREREREMFFSICKNNVANLSEIYKHMIPRISNNLIGSEE